MTDASRPRSRRADAERNRARLIAAAAALFAEEGTDAPLDEVARRAGVGNATVYRHFPTRRDLLVAVYADEVDDLCARAAAPADDPGAALFAWLDAFVAHVATKHGLAQAIPGERSALFAGWHRAMTAAVDGLLDRARSAGTVRPDVEAADLLTLATGVALTVGDDPQRAARALALLRHGVEPGPPPPDA